MGFKVISVQQATGSTGYSYGTVLNYSKVRYLGIWVYIIYTHQVKVHIFEHIFEHICTRNLHGQQVGTHVVCMYVF